MLLALVIIGGAAAAVPLVHRRWPAPAVAIAIGAPLIVFAGLAWRLPKVLHGGAVVEEHRWAPDLGVTAAFRLDGLSAMFALVIVGIGVLIVSYSVPYLRDRSRLGHLLGLLLVFMASMLGLVLADDAVVLFVFWEMTSISSFFLIGFNSVVPESRSKALQALIITSAGGLALLVGLLLLGQIGLDAGLAPGEARRLSYLAQAGVADHGSYVAVVLLVCLGAFTKSAQVPFHFWLPGAMVAPTPVSAYLHAATMVKAGVYLLARLAPALGGTALWAGILGGVGAATMLVGAVMAVTQRDLKLVLAYATVAVLGALTMLIGIGTDKALQAFVVLFLAHACYKAALFLLSGVVDHACGTRDAYSVGALRQALPGSAVITLVAAASMAGLPPLLGFLAKEDLLAAALEGTGAVAPLLGAAAATAGALLVAAALVVSVAPFFRGEPVAGNVHEVSPAMLLAPGVLAVAGVVIGVAAGALNGLVGAVGGAIAGRPVEADVALWHGLSPPHGTVLLLSAGSLLVGVLGYRYLSGSPPAREPARPAWARALAPSRVYERGIARLWAVAGWNARVLQSGLLRRYLVMTLLTAAVLVGAPLAVVVATGIDVQVLEVRPDECLIAVLIVAGALKVVVSTERLTAVVAVGASGLGISFLFALLSAPDLAITQLMVETLMVILLVLVFRTLPPAKQHHPRARRTAHAVVAGALGLVVALLVLALGRQRFPADAAAYYLSDERSAGDNVVNAILVEYRALDTLGEITVLAIAGMGVYALLRFTRTTTEER